MTGARSLRTWPLVVALLLAVTAALAQPIGHAPVPEHPTTGAPIPASGSASTAPPPRMSSTGAAPAPTAPASAGGPASAAPVVSAAAPPSSSAAPASATAVRPYLSAISPLPGDRAVPADLLPPGAAGGDDGPSKVIFPPQKITLRFNHKLHLKQGATCKTCHSAALTSGSANDSLIPQGTTCDACHGTDHSDPTKVTPGDEESGKCGFCHRGWEPSDGNRVARLELPRANLHFTHKKHLARNIQCGQCHGAVEELELSTRDQLPRMSGCFHCHQRDDAASQGDARSACTTCHIKAVGEGPPRVAGEAPGLGGGRMRTVFASGVLQPPRWLGNAAHTPDFLQRHRMVAAADSSLCANCHKEDYCTDCHDGRVRPRDVHPSDYLSMHPVEARMAMQRCRSCHEEQSFCLTCHLRVGVAMSSPTGDRDSSRFHPPKEVWSDVPVTPQHHKFQAERNLNSCVSCHTERDCVTCHGANGIGGGFNPHRANFLAGCGTQFRRNPRPCLVCHEPTDGVLAQCR